MHGETIRTWIAQSIAHMRPMVQARRKIPAPDGHPKPSNIARPPRAMLTGAQGVGKTAALVGRDGQSGALHDARGVISIMLLPTHSKAEEAARDYNANATSCSPRHYIVRGRGSPDPEGSDDQKMCLVNDQASAIAKSGLSVRDTLCMGCPFKDQCGYLRQERDLARLALCNEGLVLFAPHDYAFVPLPAKIEPDLIVFDERPRDFGVEQQSLLLSELKEAIQLSDNTRNGTKETILPTLEQRTVQAVLDKLAALMTESPSELLGTLRKTGICEDALIKTASSLKILANKCRVTEGLEAQIENSTASAEARSTRKSKVSKLDVTRRASVLLEILAREMKAGHKSPTSVTVSSTCGGATSDDALRIHLCRLKPLRFGEDKPFLHLDGTGDIAIARTLFGADLVHCHYPVERNAKVTQVLGRSFSKRSICGIEHDGGTCTDDQAAKFRSELLAIIDRMEDTAVIGSKAVIAVLGLRSDPRARHFGALRGLNSLEAFSKVVVIGREQPSPIDIDRIARAFASANGDCYRSGSYFKEVRPLRLAQGRMNVDVLRHPDGWGDCVLKQIREAEIEQAIDRIRLIHNEHAKEVILLTPVVLDITVNKVVKWIHFRVGGTRIERARESTDFLPISSRECVRLFPTLWKNPQTAAADLCDAGLNKGMILQNITDQLPQAHQVCHISYRRDQKRAREHQGLAFVPVDTARRTVEEIAGPLREFKVISEMDLSLGLRA